MKKTIIRSVLILFNLFLLTSLYAQDRITVKGNILDGERNSLPGAYVAEKGTKNIVHSDLDGAFSIDVTPNAILEITYIGYQQMDVPVNNRAYILIIMEEDAILLDNVVVSALGLKKNESSLAYSIKQVAGDELTRVKDQNMIASLAGKIAGVQINRTSSGLGSSAKILMRGIRSVIGNNQPLFVIDGIPILNSTNEQASTAVGGTADAGNRDGGDGISNLNPEDIESMSILKGAPAAALYGSQAANGVILITTKKGSKDITKVSFSSNITFESPFSLPQFQNSYGSADRITSWGEKSAITSYDNLGDFFKTGTTYINSLSVSSGNEKYQTYFSYANTQGSGILPNGEIGKHNLNFRESASLFNDRLRLDGNINIFHQKLENRNTSGGFYMNPLVGLYRFPRGEDITPYRENFEIWDAERNMMVQNWHSDIQDFEQNPYWIANRIKSKDTRNRAMASLFAEFTPGKYLTIQGRASLDLAFDYIRQQFYASTAPALAGSNGRYVEMNFNESLLYGDLMALYKRTFGKFKVDVAVGTSINRKTVNSLRYDSKTASLKYPNVFTIANINMSGAAYISQQIDAIREIQSIFSTVQLGYNEQLFLDITARNDWSSTLAFTPHEKSGFFYPSVGVSWMVNKSFALPSWVSYFKTRAVWSKVGNDIPLFITNPVAHVQAGGEVESIDAAPFRDMEPEMTNSIEIGTEIRLFDNRLNTSITWYKSNTYNQFFKLPAQTGDKYAYRYVNAGNIENRGWEISISGYPISSGLFTWRSEVNCARNKNLVVELHDQLPVFLYGPYGFSSSYAMRLKQGGSFGDIYGKAFQRDSEGNILYSSDGLPLVEGEGNLNFVGNCYPDFVLSWNNTLSLGDFSFSFLFDSRFGGKVLSQTQADMDQFGTSLATGDARDMGYVLLEGHKIENVEGFFRNTAGGRAGVTEYYMYDATNIRLREFSLTYRLPQKWFRGGNVINNISLSLVARNLFFIYKQAPFDPDLILSTGNDNQGIEVYGMPTTRNIGFNIKIDF